MYRNTSNDAEREKWLKSDDIKRHSVNSESELMNEIEQNNYQGEKSTSTNKMSSKLLIFLYINGK